MIVYNYSDITLHTIEGELTIMKPYNEMSREELEAQRAELTKQFEQAKEKGLKLDMSRGKPNLHSLIWGWDFWMC